MTDDESLADIPTYRAMEEMMDSPASRAMKEMMNSPASRAMKEMMNSPATRAIEGLFSSSPKPDYSRLLEVLEQERERKHAYEEAVIQLARQPAIQPPPEPPPPPPPPRPKKRRESYRAEEWNRWKECAAGINEGRAAKGMRPLNNKSKLALAVIEKPGLHNAPRTVREKL